jgi:tetratricopeptide (TPR) repeat protein
MAFNKAKAMQEAEKLVAQRKNSDAIKQYLRILDKDPDDVSLLNTIGDLYYRENNKAEALKCFDKLADAYTRDGFTVKAIAILKKIVKIDSSAIDPVLKMAELYVLQGLNREAREQYGQAVEFFKKKKLPDRALETFRKIVALDPENRTYRTRLAELAEQMGRKDEAGRAYAEVAESALRAGDAAAAEAALKKASDIDPRNSDVQLLRARLAASQKDYKQAEKILQSDSALRNSPTGRQLLLEIYLATQRLEAGEKLVGETYRANPEDFSPLGHFARLCLQHGQVDAATRALSACADLLIQKKQAMSLMETLRHIWSQHAEHLPTLELVLSVSEKTGDEASLPEVLGALADAYERAGDLGKAEGVLRTLVKREPGNEEYQRRLRDVLEQQGKETEVPSAASFAGVALEVPEEEEEAPPPPAPVVDEQAQMVKEALENSDLFSRYGLIDKAVAELEKALATYPEQVEIHRRIFEVCHRNQPERASKAAEMLAQVFRRQGDLATAGQYEEAIRQLASGGAVAEVAIPGSRPAVPPVEPPPQPVELDLSEAFAGPAQEDVVPPAEPATVEIPIEVSTPAEAPATPAAPQELDLSAELDAFAAPSRPVELPSVEAPPPEAAAEVPAAAQFNFEEARVEVDFYLSQGFTEEARNAVQALEETFPGEPRVAELRALVEGGPGAPSAQPAEPLAPPVGLESPLGPAEPTPLVVEELPVAAGAKVEIEPPPPATPAMPQPPIAPPPADEAPPSAAGDLLGDLAGDLAAGLEGFGEPSPPGQAPSPTGPAPPQDVSPLSGLLDELGDGGPVVSAQEDAETHYNLGVAFREMGLLDEAIGEFQKVVKGAQKGHYPENFLQACSLLAVSFMDKGMPQIAAKWYMRALETPELDEESTLALQYDLGVAYEQAGDTHGALEKFSEVYSQNIDYRDVAEKIRALQQKAR